MANQFFLFVIRNRTWVLLAAIGWAIAGAVVAMRTPMDAVPDLSENQVLIVADWPGHEPVDVERQITRPLSLELKSTPGLRAVRGSSEVGFALLYLIFDDAIAYADARRLAQQQLALTKSELPPGVVPQLAAEGISTGQIYWYTVEGSGHDLAALRAIQDTLVAPRLGQVQGVAEVSGVGGFTAEKHVEVDPAALAHANWTLTEFHSAVQDTLRSAAETANLENQVVAKDDGASLRLGDIARVVDSVAPRQGVFEKDGNEAVAGIVHIRYGENPLEVTSAIKTKLRELSDDLPEGVRLVPCYDRTPLIFGAVGTVTRTLLESLLVTTLCVVLVLRHARTSLVITLSLPLAVLGAFLGMEALRLAGVADVQTNIMSLAGIVVSIGVLVDSGIVVAENVTHELRKRFGDEPIEGNVDDIVARACATVAIPAGLATLIMVVSFLPVFYLRGIDGRMYQPLAWTKTLALLSSALVTVTVVPALCATWIRGRLRDESENAIVRSVVAVYRPTLSYLLDHPLPLVLLLAVTLIVAAAATGADLLVRIAVGVGVIAVWWASAKWPSRIAWAIALVVLALFCQSAVHPLRLALRTPLDEGMVMDMPITSPRIPIAQAVDDLKSRNMILCRFPEVAMVTGKAGRADTPFDPAPLDMIETMVEFRPTHLWPHRCILRRDAELQAAAIVGELSAANLVEAPADSKGLVTEIVESGLPRFDAIQRELCWQRWRAFQAQLSRELPLWFVKEAISRSSLRNVATEADIQVLAARLPVNDRRRLAEGPDPISVRALLRELSKRQAELGGNATSLEFQPSLGLRLANTARSWMGFDLQTIDDEMFNAVRAEFDRRAANHVSTINSELRKRSIGTWTQIVCTELFARQPILDDELAKVWDQTLAARYGGHHNTSKHGHGKMPFSSLTGLPVVDPHARYDAVLQKVNDRFQWRTWLWPHDSDSLTKNGGELDRSVQMPGWANVWTRPIQNRVDMLTSGVNSEVGVRVLGEDLDQVVLVSEAVAEVLREVPGAANVIADPIRGKGTLDVRPDVDHAASHGANVAEIDAVIETALRGMVVDGGSKAKEKSDVRIVFRGGLGAGRDYLKSCVVPFRKKADSNGTSEVTLVPLPDVANIRIIDAPATIKSDQGFPRNYVRLNVHDRDPADFVADARRHVKQEIQLPDGIRIEWTGQYEHAAKTRATMLWLVPIVVVAIFGILYVAYFDLVDACLMLLAVPGALAGGALCQWILGVPFSVAVGVGYIACFGMAAATSMVMLVYLREAVASAGGLNAISLEQLRSAVLTGAVHRLRPKLLTEATTLLSLAPMLWSGGPGADVIRPMAAPVLGGILIADEVVDLLLPLAFFYTQRARWLNMHKEPMDTSSDEPNV
jgi:Cu(I)/Ag(I) efflux system membrane protein CusA/SilA